MWKCYRTYEDGVGHALIDTNPIIKKKVLMTWFVAKTLCPGNKAFGPLTLILHLQSEFLDFNFNLFFLQLLPFEQKGFIFITFFKKKEFESKYFICSCAEFEYILSHG